MNKDNLSCAICGFFCDNEHHYNNWFDTTKPNDIKIMPSLESFNFKNMRKSKGLTLREVETITGISNPYLSQLETGKIKSPSYNTVRTLVLLYHKT